MKKSTIAILEEIQRERDRRSALTRRELELAYEELKRSGYAALPSPELRRIAIIALGWVYAPSQLQMELDCLCDHLLNDEDALCRAWSASAFMQLSFHQAPVEPIRERSLPAFRQSLEQETDDFIVGVSVESIKELWELKFRLSDAAVERREHEAIEKARKWALRLLVQL